MTEMSQEDPDGMMFTEGFNDRSKKRLLDDGKFNTTPVGPLKKMTTGALATVSYDNQNLAYMDQESMISFQKN